MNKQSITRSYGKAVLQAKANSPHIFFAGGLIGVVVSGVLACRATLKLEKELDQIRTDLDSARQSKELVESTNGEYTQKDYAKELGGVYLKSSLTVVKLYAPSIILGSASIAALSNSHMQLTRRNAALSSSLALVGQAFNDYRDRVREVLGEEQESNIYRGLTACEIDVDGKKVLAQCKDPDAPFGSSPYAVCFDERSKFWQKSVEMNRIFLELQQVQANNRLNSVGYVFLNEVYRSIGMPETTQGQLMGWLRFSPDGDSYVDFGMYDAVNSPNSKTPYDRSIWLDFNIDPTPIFQQLG